MKRPLNINIGEDCIREWGRLNISNFTPRDSYPDCFSYIWKIFLQFIEPIRMKVLLLLRHGEAESSSVKVDFERNLTDFGKLQIVKVANRLMFQKLRPQLIISSPAQRTQETAGLICSQFLFDREQVVYEPALYHDGIEAYLDQIFAVDDAIDVLMVVGHNPSISLLANYLTNEDSISMSPGSMVGLEFEMSNWNMICSCSPINLFTIHD